MARWYVKGERGTEGPLSIQEIAHKIRAKSLELEALAYEHGDPQWRPLKDVDDLLLALAESPDNAPPPNDLQSLGLFMAMLGSALNTLRPLASSSRLQRVNDLSSRLAPKVGFAALSLAFVTGLIAAVSVSEAQPAFMGTGLFLGGGLTLYTALRMVGALEHLLTQTRHRMRSPELLDCLGAILVLGGGVLITNGIASAIEGSASAAMISLGGGLTLFVIALLSFSPSVMGVEFSDDASDGETMISILLFLPRCALQMMVVFLNVGLIVVNVIFITAAWDLIAGRTLMGGVEFLLGAGALFSVTLAPFFCYLAYLAIVLLLDIAKAILILPSKLDALQK